MKQKTKISDYVPFTIRITEDLHKKIVKMAEKEHRSINSQILIILEKGLDEQAKKIAQSI